ncbi:MAG TPA: hypothetical protein VF195_06210 [Actinomycetota bacterium]
MTRQIMYVNPPIGIWIPYVSALNRSTAATICAFSALSKGCEAPDVAKIDEAHPPGVGAITDKLRLRENAYTANAPWRRPRLRRPSHEMKCQQGCE